MIGYISINLTFNFQLLFLIITYYNYIYMYMQLRLHLVIIGCHLLSFESLVIVIRRLGVLSPGHTPWDKCNRVMQPNQMG